MLEPLTPVTLEASEIVAVADVPALLNGIAALTPLPAGKTIAQINMITIVKQANGAYKVDYRFSS